MKTNRTLPAVLCILDGWGWRDDGEGNAIDNAHPAAIESLQAKFPHLLLRAAGAAVGLPQGQIGNSEVGHLAMGAGRPVRQILTRIFEDVERGNLSENPVLQAALRAAAENESTLHLMGLLSDGGVHSHQVLAEEVVRAAASFRTMEGSRIPRVCVHAFLDGRDTAPQSAIESLSRFQRVLDEAGIGEVASVMGRFFAMDRDKNWDRTQRAWRALAWGEGNEAPSWEDAVRDAYAKGETDEFVYPTLICPEGRSPAEVCVRSDDSVIFFNYRADRARQLTAAFALGNFAGFDRPGPPALSRFTCFAPYDQDWNLPAIYVPDRPGMTFGEILSRNGLPQYRIAETEKYAHVTYFFNGGREQPYEGEERILVPSEKVRSYAQLPEMKANAIADAVVGVLNERNDAAIVVNFANADMVGHSGDLEATTKACRVVDRCVDRLAKAILDKGGIMLLTADHGNAELMIDPKSGGPHTAHTTNPVPATLIGESCRGASVPAEAELKDVAPTLMHLLGIDASEKMTGRSLLDLQ